MNNYQIKHSFFKKMLNCTDRKKCVLTINK